MPRIADDLGDRVIENKTEALEIRTYKWFQSDRSFATAFTEGIMNIYVHICSYSKRRLE